VAGGLELIGVVEVIVAAITAGSVVVVALISNRTRQHAKAAREELQNDHSSNIRHDIDGLGHRLDSIVEWQTEHSAASMRGHRRTTRLEVATAGLLVGALASTIIRVARK
jgi:hypothetical protein